MTKANNLESNKRYGAYKGAVIAVPILLIRELGLSAAVFLQQASFLSSLKGKSKGWFDLAAEGKSDPSSKNIFEQHGSWNDSLGIKRGTLKKIRNELKELGLLEEKITGVPARLFYRVDLYKYKSFLLKLEQNKNAVSDHENSELDCDKKQASLSSNYTQGAVFIADYSIDQENNEKTIESDYESNALNKLIKLNVESKDAKKWIEIRKSNSLSTTVYTVEEILKEAIEANLELPEVIKYCLQKGWNSFKSSWNYYKTSEKNKDDVSWILRGSFKHDD